MKHFEKKRKKYHIKRDSGIIQFKLLLSRKPSHRYLLNIVLQNLIVVIVNYTHVGRLLFVLLLRSLRFNCVGGITPITKRRFVFCLVSFINGSLDERINASSNGAEAFEQ